MMPKQQLNSVSNLPRGKSTRRFGTDLTNLPTYKSKSKIKMAPSEYYKHGLLTDREPRQRYTRKASILNEIKMPKKSIDHHPLQDHFQDIKCYMTDVAIYWTCPEDYMKWHSDINPELRQNLVGWLIKLQIQFNLSQNSLTLAVNLIDNYCYRKSINKNRYQLLGICSLFMAAKYQQITTPRMSRFLESCGLRYIKKDLVQMESDILQSLNFQINKIVSVRQLTFMRIEDVLTCNRKKYENAEDPNQNSQKTSVIILCQYILEMMLLQYQINLLSPNYLSASLLYVACKMKNVEGIKSKGIIDRYGLIQERFKQCFFAILNIYKRKDELKFKQINRKYLIIDQQY